MNIAIVKNYCVGDTHYNCMIIFVDRKFALRLDNLEQLKDFHKELGKSIEEYCNKYEKQKI